MNLNNKQLSLIITFCLMGIFVLTIFNIRLAGEKEEEFLYELSFDEELLEEIPQEEVKMTELETHQAFNEAAKSSYARELEEFKTLEELTRQMEEAGEENPENDQELGELSENLGLAKQYAEKLKKQKEILQQNQKKEDAEIANVKRRTTISYSLVDRMHRSLPNPIYTCESFGKVVINVEVNALGEVVEANFNSNSSTTSNGCLVDNAIYYAMQSRFEPKPSKDRQLGSITYLFQGE